MPRKKRDETRPVVDNKARMEIDKGKNEKVPLRRLYAGLAIRDASGHRVDPSTLGPCLVIDRRQHHQKEIASGPTSGQPNMNSDQSSASQNSPKFDTRALSIPKALEPEKSSKTMDPAVSERTTGLKPLEVMAKRKRDQQEEDEGEANLPWYTRDYDSDELGLMGDTDLDKVLDAFYDEGAKDSERKGPEDNAPAKRRRREPQSRVPDIHVTAVEEFFPRNDPSVCKSLDPRVYWKHPLGCGCNNKISHSASVETTTVSDNSTDYTSLFGAPSCYTETARSTAASDPRRRHPGSIFEQVECNRKPPSAASSSITGTTRYTAAPSPMATYDLAPEHLSPVLYSRDAPYDLQDWNEEYLELLQPNENERRALGE